MIIENLIRENIKSLKPYSSAREEFKNSASNLVYLDANGVTIKACPNAQIGDTGNVNGFTYSFK